MATYVISDIHGEYDQFINLLEKIDLQEEDTLYILGDVLDRGPHPIKIIKKLMTMKEKREEKKVKKKEKAII